MHSQIFVQPAAILYEIINVIRKSSHFVLLLKILFYLVSLSKLQHSNWYESDLHVFYTNLTISTFKFLFTVLIRLEGPSY